MEGKMDNEIETAGSCIGAEISTSTVVLDFSWKYDIEHLTKLCG